MLTSLDAFISASSSWVMVTGRQESRGPWCHYFFALGSLSMYLIGCNINRMTRYVHKTTVFLSDYDEAILKRLLSFVCDVDRSRRRTWRLTD